MSNGYALANKIGLEKITNIIKSATILNLKS